MVLGVKVLILMREEEVMVVQVAMVALVALVVVVQEAR